MNYCRFAESADGDLISLYLRTQVKFLADSYIQIPQHELEVL